MRRLATTVVLLFLTGRAATTKPAIPSYVATINQSCELILQVDKKGEVVGALIDCPPGPPDSTPLGRAL